jgi:hypothetical protein
METALEHYIWFEVPHRTKVMEWAKNHQSLVGRCLYTEIIKPLPDRDKCKSILYSLNNSSNDDDISFRHKFYEWYLKG